MRMHTEGGRADGLAEDPVTVGKLKADKRTESVIVKPGSKARVQGSVSCVVSGRREVCVNPCHQITNTCAAVHLVYACQTFPCNRVVFQGRRYKYTKLKGLNKGKGSGRDRRARCVNIRE